MSTQNTGGDAQHRAVTCAPLACILLVMLTQALFFHSFLSCPEERTTPEQCIRFDTGAMLQSVKTDHTSDPSVYSGGVMWILVCGLHVLVSLAALFASVRVMREGVGRRLKGLRGAVTLGLLLAWAACVALLPTLWMARDRVSPAPRLMLMTVGQILPNINTHNRLFDALGLTVGLMLAVAACAAIMTDSAQDPDGKALARRMRLLRMVLYAGAAALVVGVVRLSVTLNWGVSYLPAPADAAAAAKGASALVTGIVSTLGIYYTILLAAVYVPAVLVLRARAYSLPAFNEQPPEKQSEWLKARGLSFSFMEHLPRVVVILGPLLVGPVGDLVRGLLKVGG